MFLKAVPVTDLELDRGFATRNHYELLSYYQYGVGSAGFGVWRELITNLTATNWVLEGAVDGFAMLYHWRVVRRPHPPSSEHLASLDDYVRNWNSSAAVGRYAKARQSATHVVLLFLEWLPQTLWDHLADWPDDIRPMVEQLRNTVSFLHEHGILHFDAHFGNVVTDGERPHLVDFGLAVDTRFDLSPAEQEFLQLHSHDDYGEVIVSLGVQIVRWYEALPDPERTAVRSRLDTTDDPATVRMALLRKAERLAGTAHPALVDAALTYRDVIEYMDRFLSDQRANERKNTPFDDALLRRLLIRTGMIN